MNSYRIAVFAILSFGLISCQGGGEDLVDATGSKPPSTTDISVPQACKPPTANPLRNAYFGELHLHTVYSLDAVATQLTPADAYRFAMGLPVAAPPYDAAGNSLVPPLRIDRALDFAAVTDHSEWLGEKQLCTDPELDPVAYYSPECIVFRTDEETGFLLFGGGWAGYNPITIQEPSLSEPDYITDEQIHRPLFCGAFGEKCRAAARAPWLDIQLQAELFNQPGCFTTFNGYEYTMSPQSDNMHRNVIFSGSRVPAQPISVYEAPDPTALWAKLDEACSGDCEYLTIPHNSNLSNGRMFKGPYEGGYDIEDKRRVEPLIEIFQVKGDSECSRVENASSDDPLCDFEKLPATNFTEFFLGVNILPPAPAFQNYVRYGLKQGLVIEQDFGANPFQYGFIASTDSHFGLPGAVDEQNFPGHRDVPPAVGIKDDSYNNPGGLAVAWAEENTRESIFAAFKRKETYGTSGPRIQLRVFGGTTDSIPVDLCAQGGQAFVQAGYAGGVPMGGELLAGQGQPRFAAWATADIFPRENERSTSVPLQRLQLVKGWVESDANGNSQTREMVIDLAEDSDSNWELNTEDCTVKGGGSTQLCSVWDDPDFDPAENAFYYVRVVEQPTCRWLTRQCLNAPDDLDCSSPTPEWAGCCELQNGDYSASLQERAWSSPIWYKR